MRLELPNHLYIQKYLTFRQQMLPDSLRYAPTNLRVIISFHHKTAAAHFLMMVGKCLYIAFSNRWTGCGGPIAWRPRSPYLSCLDFFLWEQLKSVVYETPISSN
ncbi:hypothetical protein AVEN_30120-1 [Araneus ventricosus]|uniref:Uncharacterized protein n=1 Tax=Araneus ventricosus TaxID=182803 RepID=A0A4Y2CHX9_ARAVE|nr:hypothetical protein AVEN_30120-1 [Araneus ventricosus]